MRWSTSLRPDVRPILLLLITACLASCVGCASKAKGQPRAFVDPPLPKAEMRAIFVATAYNTDWPSKPSMHRRIQRDEMAAVVARAKDLNCNTIILQVRAFGDRIYRKTSLAADSGGKYKDEPWAQALAYGNDPDPRPIPDPQKYDPMEEWIDACNKAGLELHAWINPFRINKLVTVKSGGEDKYLPVVKWEKQLYLDPTSEAVQEYVRAVINDFFDHYPPESNASYSAADIARTGTALMLMANGDGPEGVIYDHQMPGGGGGGAMRPVAGPFARASIQLMSAPTATITSAEKRLDYLKSLYDNAPANKKIQDAGTKQLSEFLDWSYEKSQRKGARFGLSPDARDEYNYVRPQLAKKYVDYVIPELYGDDAGDPFVNDIRFWLDQLAPVADDPDAPQIIIGVNAAAVQLPDNSNLEDGRSPDVIAKQMQLVRDTAGTRNGRKAVGDAHYSGSGLRLADQGGPAEDRNLGKKLKEGHYKEPARRPVARHADDSGNKPNTPTTPQFTTRNGVEYVTWDKGTGNGRSPRQWEVWIWRQDTGWSDMIVLDKYTRELKVDAAVKRVRVKAVDKRNRESDFARKDR